MGEKMDKKCSLCGNIYKNRVFRGGFICADCADFIKNIDVTLLFSGKSRKHIKSIKANP